MIHLVDIDRSIVELNLAIAEHHAWAGKLLQLSLLGGEPDEAITHEQAHEKCCFSVWFSRFKIEPSRYQRLVEHIYDMHIIMHDRARELLTSITEKRVTEQVLQQYHDAQQQFVYAIDKYKQALLTFRNMHDTLTGLPLRHLLYLDFEHIRTDPQRSATLWLLMMDIDRFKTVNDVWGHNAGDDVLRDVAATLEAGTNHDERIYRFGGEEFVVLLNRSSEQDAMDAARHIRAWLEQHPVVLENAVLPVTVTGGLTRVSTCDSLHTAIGRADRALYYGKNSGRNRCVLATREEEMVTL
ncbi:diguanylate cyclase [Siccibacter turicensis]|uniref:diguanylate cyclase n=1 Tax=Siccibacter turicensis TaxID=357233 RepID=UPI0026B4616D|nr:diguanylate cyclase [Siccibacter turicensis]